MKKRSPAVQRVLDAALAHFSVQGYDASSLSEIAGMVGIRKASLYAHFDNKDALFLAVLEEAVEVETTHIDEVFADRSDDADAGAAYVHGLAGRHARSVHLRFLLRAAFHYPAALKATIGRSYEPFLAHLGRAFARQLRSTSTGAGLDPDRIALYAEAYVGIVESLFVELNFIGPDRMEARRKALWTVLLDSLKVQAATT